MAAFDPGPRGIQILYRNWRGEERMYLGDRTTLRRKREHVTLKVAPSGRRIAFAWKRLLNRDAVELALRENPAPSGTDLQVLRYHAKRGTTSLRHEEVKRKFPNW